MDKKAVIDYFDSRAAGWDNDMIRREDILSTIMTLGGIHEGIDVLDVACGTGILFPDYLDRKVASITGIDISPEMAKIAASKFPQVNVICGDVENTDFGKQFDVIMVYNAFPHFPDPAKLIETLAGLTKPGGRLSVAHGMSRAMLTDHHRNVNAISIDLLHEQDLARLFSRWFDVDVVISTDRMYQVSGVRRDPSAPAETTHSHGGVSHSHAHGSHDHNHDTGETPANELLALMTYMVKHNDAHAQELVDLANQLQSAGKERAYSLIMNAVADFDVANARLDSIAQDLAAEIL